MVSLSKYSSFLEKHSFKQVGFITYSILLSFALSTTSIAPVHATSVYDNTLVMTSSLKYNDENENVIDISDNWKTRLHAACGSTIYNSFVQSLNGGAWAVNQDGTDDDYGVSVMWSNPDHTIPASSFYDSGSMRYVGIDPGWQGKARFHFNSSTDTDVCDYSTVPFNSPYYGHTLTLEPWSAPLGLYQSTYTLNYPSGYAGSSLPQATNPTPITGYAYCAGSNLNYISHISIAADSGIDGLATLSPVEPNGVAYSYYLSEHSDYHLVVTCDGEPYFSPTVDVNHYDSYAWACTTVGQSPVCAAS